MKEPCNHDVAYAEGVSKQQNAQFQQIGIRISPKDVPIISHFQIFLQIKSASEPLVDVKASMLRSYRRIQQISWINQQRALSSIQTPIAFSVEFFEHAVRQS